jgi:nucleoside-diphosphate-sugar epimerase
MLSYYYFKQYNIRCIRARICNTTGPGKRGDVLSDLMFRITNIDHGEELTLRVGNLKSERAILDVCDTVSALELLADKGHPGEVYNICSKDYYSIREFIKLIEEMTGRKYNIGIDPALVRSNDEHIILCDTTKLENDTGWKQVIPIKETLQKMYDFWENEYKIVHNILRSL